MLLVKGRMHRCGRTVDAIRDKFVGKYRIKCKWYIGKKKIKRNPALEMLKQVKLGDCRTSRDPSVTLCLDHQGTTSIITKTCN